MSVQTMWALVLFVMHTRARWPVDIPLSSGRPFSRARLVRVLFFRLASPVSMPDKECVSAVGWFWMTLNARKPRAINSGLRGLILIFGLVRELETLTAYRVPAWPFEPHRF